MRDVDERMAVVKPREQLLALCLAHVIDLLLQPLAQLIDQGPGVEAREGGADDAPQQADVARPRRRSAWASRRRSGRRCAARAERGRRRGRRATAAWTRRGSSAHAELDALARLEHTGHRLEGEIDGAEELAHRLALHQLQ